MARYEEIIIFGAGGVGSWLSNYLIRTKLTDKLSVVDFDVVEEKNLVRQDFKNGDRGISKVDVIGGNSRMYQNPLDNDAVHVASFNRKIVDDIDFTGLNKDAIAIIATDNIKSKVMIANHFKKFLMVNCDKNFVEVKNHLDKTDTAAWDMGGGYSNEQDIISNVYAANLVLTLLKA